MIYRTVYIYTPNTQTVNYICSVVFISYKHMHYLLIKNKALTTFGLYSNISHSLRSGLITYITHCLRSALYLLEHFVLEFIALYNRLVKLATLNYYNVKYSRKSVESYTWVHKIVILLIVLYKFSSYFYLNFRLIWFIFFLHIH